MKTDNAVNKGNIRYQVNERNENTPRNKKADLLKKDNAFVLDRLAKEKKDEPKMEVLDQLKNVKRHIQDNIRWRDMRFYRHQENGKMYVDIIDRESGDVLKTIPETEFIKLVAHEEKKLGISINISG